MGGRDEEDAVEKKFVCVFLRRLRGGQGCGGADAVNALVWLVPARVAAPLYFPILQVLCRGSATPNPNTCSSESQTFSNVIPVPGHPRVVPLSHPFQPSPSSRTQPTGIEEQCRPTTSSSWTWYDASNIPRPKLLTDPACPAFVPAQPHSPLLGRHRQPDQHPRRQGRRDRPRCAFIFFLDPRQHPAYAAASRYPP